MQGRWEGSGVPPTLTTTSQEQLYTLGDRVTFGGGWSALQPIACEATHDLACFFTFI